MPRPKPNKLHDELDALLDGGPVELTDELAPLVEAADALRAELAAYQLDPAVADRHLERVLDGSAAVVRLPVRTQPNGWDLRRRLAAVALAAALVLVPATMASAAALPGQAMYPFKLAIEQLRIASVQWSPAREAGERTRVADERLEELDQVVELGMVTQVAVAIRAVDRAVIAATRAVQDARMEGADVTKVAGKLQTVKQEQRVQLATLFQRLPTTPVASVRKAIVTAVQQSPQGVPPPGGDTMPSDPAANGIPTPTPPDPGGDPNQATPPSQTTQTTEMTPTTKPEPPTTTTQTTTPEPTTTEPTQPSAPEDTTGSVDDQSLDEAPPPSTVPGP
jgi:hypothetical protein